MTDFPQGVRECREPELGLEELLRHRCQLLQQHEEYQVSGWAPAWGPLQGQWLLPPAGDMRVRGQLVPCCCHPSTLGPQCCQQPGSWPGQGDFRVTFFLLESSIPGHFVAIGHFFFLRNCLYPLPVYLLCAGFSN